MTEKEKILAAEVSALPAEAARQEADRKARERGDDDDTAAGTGTACQVTPKPKAQPNFTDPDSKIMLTANCDAAGSSPTAMASSFFIAPGSRRRDDPPPVAHADASPPPRPPSNAYPRKLPPSRVQQVCARRKAIVEPVFGQMSTLQNTKHLLQRGFEQARAEWLLLAACHNLRKLHGHIGVTGLTALPAH